MKANELSEGDRIPEKTYENISIDEMRLMSAIMRDYNPVHFDPKAAERSGYPKRLTQGPIFTSYTTQAVLELVEQPYDIRTYSVRYEDNVFEGDSVTASGTVVEKQATDDGYLLTLDLETTRGDGTVVLSGSATVRVPSE